MEMRHLATFEAVVKGGSFQGAANALDCAQSTVTLHVQGLEASLGVTLFERGGRRVRLTEAGRALHAQAGPLLNRVAAVRETMAELATGEAGHIRLGCMEPCASQRLPDILVRFCRERPGVRLSVEVGGTLPTARAVAAGELDAGICSEPPASLPLTFAPLYDEPLRLLLREDHPLAARPAIRGADLIGHRVLLTEEGCAWRGLTLGSFRTDGVDVPVTVEISSLHALSRAVRSGLGIAILPLGSVTPLPPGTTVRSLDDVDLALTVGLVRPADAPPAGKALAALLAACRSHLPRG